MVVPNVVGLSCDAAKTALAQSKLVGSCTNAPSDTAPKGEVFGQSPTAGQQAPQQSTVQLQVSSGPSQVPVPDVTQTMWQDAKKTLKQAGLVPQESLCLSSDPTIPDGTVSSTDPAAGQQVNPGSTVTVYVTDSNPADPACP